MLAFKNLLLKPVLVLISFFLLNIPVNPDAVRDKAQAATAHSIQKPDVFESKGIMEPVLELVNGNNFQQTSFHFKKSFGSDAAFQLSTALQAHFCRYTERYFDHVNSIPLYIANRSILI